MQTIRLFFPLDDQKPNDKTAYWRSYNFPEKKLSDKKETNETNKTKSLTKETKTRTTNSDNFFVVVNLENKKKTSETSSKTQINNFQIRIEFWCKIKPLNLGCFFVWTITDQTNKQPRTPWYFTSNWLQKANIFKSEFFCGQMMSFIGLFFRLDDHKQTTKQPSSMKRTFPQKQTQRKKKKKTKQTKQTKPKAWQKRLKQEPQTAKNSLSSSI